MRCVYARVRTDAPTPNPFAVCNNNLPYFASSMSANFRRTQTAGKKRAKNKWYRTLYFEIAADSQYKRSRSTKKKKKRWINNIKRRMNTYTVENIRAKERITNNRIISVNRFNCYHIYATANEYQSAVLCVRPSFRTLPILLVSASRYYLKKKKNETLKNYWTIL